MAQLLSSEAGIRTQHTPRYLPLLCRPFPGPGSTRLHPSHHCLNLTFGHSLSEDLTEGAEPIELSLLRICQ